MTRDGPGASDGVLRPLAATLPGRASDRGRWVVPPRRFGRGGGWLSSSCRRRTRVLSSLPRTSPLPITSLQNLKSRDTAPLTIENFHLKSQP